MILPIVAYGAPILKKKCAEIHSGYPALTELIDNMWDTLYNANGCGLAAPQVNLAIRLFLVDSTMTYGSMSEEERSEYFDGDKGIKQVFINPRIIKGSNHNLWTDEEGCLSIPGLSGMVERPWEINVAYLDHEFKEQQATFSGVTARMILHEYDHIEGKLYLDYLSPLKRQMMKSKLEKIASGKALCKYPLVYY